MYNQYDAHVRAWFRNKWNNDKDDLMMRAMKASNRAQSWRNFNVGCAVLAYKADASIEDRWRIFVGANVKVTQDARPVCAEMTAILTALHSDFDRIIGLSVFGKPQDEEDRESGIKPKHLHPCPDCRKTMEKLSIVAHDTMLLCVKVGPVEGSLGEEESQSILTEEMTFAELLAAHNGNGKH